MTARVGGREDEDPRWGVNLLPDAAAARVAELASQAERHGFDRCWLYDEGLATRDLYVCLTAMALATRRVELGPGITNPYTRHPGMAASATATIDELSGGRAFLGLGVGGSLTLDPLGIDRVRPARAIREAIAVARSLFSGEPSDLAGESFRLRQARMAYGDPRIPIWVAGRGRRVLAAGAELADGVSLDHIHEDFLDSQVDFVRARARDAGNDVELAYSATIVTDEPALERARCHMTYRLVDSPPEVKEAIGLSEDESEAIRSAIADGLDRAARLVRDEWVFPFVVHGTEAECAEVIGAMCRRHGFSEFTVPVPDLAFAEETLATAAAVIGLSR
jgi:5,10-methylenetetrahydromethanopterin reductase